MTAQPLKRFDPLTMARSLWEYRSFVLNMVRREFRARYLGSLLGPAWSVLTPLATILIYLVVFSAVLKGRLPGAGDPLSFGIYLCTGILVWGFFAEVVTRCQTVFVESANLLKKLAFPRITLPVIVLLNALVNFAIVGALFLLLLVGVGRFPGPVVLAALPLLVVQQGFAIGLGILFGTVYVFFRDVGQFVVVLMNLWFWGTPIVYHVSILPSWAQEILRFNPLTALFVGYQRIFIERLPPLWSDLWVSVVAMVLALLLGLVSFRRLSGEMVDEL
jgi:lipopolysaccharide transport system permease protein